eukprot:PhF_6_TR21400/c0_g1_i2/m.30752
MAGWPTSRLWLLVWLLMSFILKYAEGASPLFTDCSNVLGIEDVDVRRSGGDFEAIGCNYPSKTTTVSLTSMEAGATASILLKDGTVVAGGSGIWIKCPTIQSSRTTGPIRITVTNITFGQDATFRFTGALPPRSSLLISNNSFNLARSTIHTFTSHGGYS